jgi:excisionase family DNA binding protein
MTPAEVAKIFGVDPKTVTRWAITGKLTVVRTVGNHRRFLATEVMTIKEDSSRSRGRNEESIMADGDVVSPVSSTAQSITTDEPFERAAAAVALAAEAAAAFESDAANLTAMVQALATAHALRARERALTEAPRDWGSLVAARRRLASQVQPDHVEGGSPV